MIIEAHAYFRTESIWLTGREVGEGTRITYQGLLKMDKDTSAASQFIWISRSQMAQAIFPE